VSAGHPPNTVDNVHLPYRPDQSHSAPLLLFVYFISDVQLKGEKAAPKKSCADVPTDPAFSEYVTNEVLET
jgi:hypothetical protein